MAKIVCVLFPDPADGHPSTYARDHVPEIKAYDGGQTAPAPTRRDFKPGDLLGDVTGALGLRRFLEAAGHTLVVTSDKDEPGSELDRHLVDADVLISQPFWPAYLTRSRLERARKLKLAITAGIGSDHVDLAAAAEHGVTVAEVTFSNSISVAEHTVLLMLALVRDYLPAHHIAASGGWNIADCVRRSYDIEGMQVGIVAAGRIGQAVLKRLRAFEVGLHYFDARRLPGELEQSLGVTYHPSVEQLAETCDVLSLHCPLTPQTEGLMDADMIGRMPRGSYLINTARAKLVARDAVVDALHSGQLAGYAGDVWYPQPAPPDHPWRSMPHNGMTPHVSGATLSAQARYAAGTREILECFLEKRPIRDEYLIVDGGQFAGTGAKSYAVRC